MNNYEALIDPTDFGTIAGYLRSPQSPIHFLLHVRNRSLLAPLAEDLERAMQLENASAACLEVGRVLDDRLKEGDLLMSSRQPLNQLTPRQHLDARTVPETANCEVLYLPPFYLVHTPGLFEGTLARQEVYHPPQRGSDPPPPVRRHRMTM